MLVICMSVSMALGAQESDGSIDQDTNRFQLTPLPVVFYLPETGFGFGGVLVSTYRFAGEAMDTRPSSTQVGVSLTTKNQFLLYVPYELYMDDERWRIQGELGYYKYFYNFFGQGINSSMSDMETYDATFPRLRVSAFRTLSPRFLLGAGYQLDLYSGVRFAEGGILDRTDIAGKSESSTISNVGLQMIYDTRDAVFNPAYGWYIQASSFMSASFLGASYEYTKHILDARYYLPLRAGHTLAFHSYVGMTSGDTPLFELFFLGDNRSRGFDNRRYQDRNEWTTAVEYRFPIKGKIGGVAYMSSSTMSPRAGDVFSGKQRVAGGVGLRYRLANEGVRIRLDYAFAQEGSNFYFTVREAF